MSCRDAGSKQGQEASRPAQAAGTQAGQAPSESRGWAARPGPSAGTEMGSAFPEVGGAPNRKAREAPSGVSAPAGAELPGAPPALGPGPGSRPPHRPPSWGEGEPGRLSPFPGAMRCEGRAGPCPFHRRENQVLPPFPIGFRSSSVAGIVFAPLHSAERGVGYGPPLPGAPPARPLAAPTVHFPTALPLPSPQSPRPTLRPDLRAALLGGGTCLRGTLAPTAGQRAQGRSVCRPTVGHG